MKPAQLILKSGRVFEGKAPQWQTGAFPGEVVFTTGMTGYPESLTDPSYAGEILVFTYPLIGNYGVHDRLESQKIHARGVVVSECCLSPSHARCLQPLLSWLEEQRVPILTGVDTRALTKEIREHGSMVGAITDEAWTPSSHPHEAHLVAEVSAKERTSSGKGKRVILVDCGMKANIARCLERYPLEIVRVPYNFDFTCEDYDGVFLSNGPGDPQKCVEMIAILKKALEQSKPIFGICLGSQLLALAAGASTHKLPFGHRGHNQPVREEATGKCYITSQNHGYAIDATTLPKDWEVTFRNLNDGSVEGIAHRELPFRAVQFHPEAAPGPTDTQEFFDQFYAAL